MNETSERDASPLTQAGDEFRNSSSALLEQTLNQTATAYLRGIEATFKYAKEDDLERIVALFSDQQHRIICHGGTFSWILAQHLVVKSWVVVYLFSNLGLVSWRWFRGHLGDKG